MPKRPYRIPRCKILACLVVCSAFWLAGIPLHATAQVQPQQQEDRFQVLEKRLKDLSATVPGLNQKTDLSVTNITLQEFLEGLASTHNLNFNIDPSLNQKISNYFSDETVANILLYLARQFNLEFTFIGSIITIGPYHDPRASLPPPPRELKISYNTFTQSLSFDLHDDTLSEVAKKITQLSGRNIVILPDLYNRKVTGFVQNLPLTNALEKMAIVNSFKLNSTNDSTLVLEPLRQDEVLVTRENPDPNANYSIRKVSNNVKGAEISSIAVSRDRGGKRRVTLNVVNSPIKDIVKNMAEQAGINYFEYSDLAGSATANVTDMDFEKALGLILKDSHYTFTVEGDVYLIGDRKDEGLRTQRLIQLQYRSADSLIDIIPRELREGVEIREFKELNGILLSGSEPQIKEIEAFIRQVDKVVPMITLDVIILDVNKGKSISTGISAGTSDSSKPGGNLLGPNGINYTFGSKDINQFLSHIGLNNVFNLGKVSPNFYVSLSALENNTNINQRQTPKLSTLNGHTANLSIGNTQYYQVSTQNVVGSLTPQTVVTQQFIPVEANLSIDITPFVAGDDEVTMHINVSISNFTATTSITQPPPTSTSKFRSIIRVRNEDMIVLGGIERNTRSETASGVPILSRIPILKWIFSSRTKSDSKIVSIVFIKPTITYH
jgi:type IV pilus assembly protein PilQ